MRKNIYYVFVILFSIFLFTLLLNISWNNARVVETDGAQKISPFFGISPFFSGLLVIVIIGLLILIVEHNR